MITFWVQVVQPPLEVVQAMTCILCATVNYQTLREAKHFCKEVSESGQNGSAMAWCNTSVRGKRCLFWVQILLGYMAIDRLNLLFRWNFHPEMAVRFLLFGLFRTLVSVLVAWTAWANARAFRNMTE